MGTYALRNVVLVHGGFVDGSGWQGVYESLSRDGFRVSIVQNPTLSLRSDAEATRMIPPPAQRAMAEKAGATVSEVAASHSVYVSQPAAVATLITQAAAGAADRQTPRQTPPRTLTVSAAPGPVRSGLRDNQPAAVHHTACIPTAASSRERRPPWNGRTMAAPVSFRDYQDGWQAD